MDDYERILLVKPDVQVYKIPPRATNRAYRASEWNLDTPDWTCRLRLIAKGSQCFIKLDEKSTGQFFGQCPIDKYPGAAIETVSDSSRYFVLKLVNEQTNRIAFVGVGFVDRSDSFDLNVALQDYFKIMQMESDSSSDKDSESSAPKLDLGFKEGQTIKVNLNLGKSGNSSAKARPKGNAGALGGILLPPPPPSSGKLAFSSSNSSKSPINDDAPSSSFDQHSSGSFHQQLLDGLDSLSVSGDGSYSKSIKSGNPILTPVNSVCDTDAFATFDTILDTQPSTTSNENVISSSSSSSKKTEDDLWSDFESFRDNETSANSTPTISSTNANSTTTTDASKFDDWAKF